MGEWCAGSVLLGDVLRMHPAYRCEVDAEKRPGEFTERGLLWATRHEELHRLGVEAFRKHAAAKRFTC